MVRKSDFPCARLGRATGRVIQPRQRKGGTGPASSFALTSSGAMSGSSSRSSLSCAASRSALLMRACRFADSWLLPLIVPGLPASPAPTEQNRANRALTNQWFRAYNQIEQWPIKGAGRERTARGQRPACVLLGDVQAVGSA